MPAIHANHAILVHKTAGHGIVGIARQHRHKSPICEELRKGNSMSIFLTWGNARGKFPHPFFRLWMAHISDDFCPRRIEIGKERAFGQPTLLAIPDFRCRKSCPARDVPAAVFCVGQPILPASLLPSSACWLSIACRPRCESRVLRAARFRH